MTKRNNVKYLILSLVAVFLVLYIINPFIAIIYAVLWFDKIILGIGPVHRFGIELTTIATVMLGIIFGPVIAFIFTIISVPILYGLRYMLIPSSPPEWPLFTPSPYNFVEAIGAAVAGILAQQSFLLIFIGVWIAKEIIYVAVDRLAGKPPDIVYPVFNAIFNAVLIIYLGKFFLGLVGL